MPAQASWTGSQTRHLPTSSLAQPASFETYRVEALLGSTSGSASRRSRQMFKRLPAAATHNSRSNRHTHRCTSRRLAMAASTAFESGLTTERSAFPCQPATGVHWFWIGTHGEYDKLVG